ncbi:MAG: NUDIX domain-containing protein [Methylococcaceae bacterium]
MIKKSEIIRHETLYEGFFTMERYQFKHTLFAGGWSEPVERELFRRNNCVGVLLYDPQRDEVVLIEQFRVGAMAQGFAAEHSWLIEIVAGGIEVGETAEQVAYRESLEEAGCEIQALKLINKFYTTPGGCSELLSLFCGKVDASSIGGIHGLDEEQEDIRVFTVSFTDAYQMLEQGLIMSGIPIIALQWLALNREKLQREWLAV